jgi:hypothetical protein
MSYPCRIFIWTVRKSPSFRESLKLRLFARLTIMNTSRPVKSREDLIIGLVRAAIRPAIIA